MTSTESRQSHNDNPNKRIARAPGAQVRPLLATSNPHKLEEVRAILQPLGIEVVGLDAIDRALPVPIEDGETFEDNARIKAVAYARGTGLPCLADDSGLEVDALGGAPGVHSARFAADEVGGENFAAMTRRQRDVANNRKLLRLMQNMPDERRTARFVCAMCLAAPDGRILAETRGTFEGVIGRTPRGDHGFGYDPLLILPDRNCTSAELPPQEKNARSHRGEAARKMARTIATLNLRLRIP